MTVKKISSLLMFLFISCMAQAEDIYDAEPYLKKADIKSIKPGFGYDSERKRVTTLPCYDVQTSLSDFEGALVLSNAMSANQLEKMFEFDSSANVKVGVFSAGAEAQYLDSVKDTDNSFSLNYAQYAIANANVELKGGGIDALNKFGKDTYNAGNNTKFKMVCGDNVFTNIKQGAALVVSLNIKFANSLEKRKFQSHIGGGFGSFATVSSDMKRIADQNSIRADVNIKVYQKGGAPEELGKIFNNKKDANGHYSASCSINDMRECKNITDGLLNYVAEIFPKQFNFEEQKRLDSFGQNFAEYIPIDYIGL